MKILVVTPFGDAQWSWFGRNFGGTDNSWTFVNLSLFGKRPWVWFWRALCVAPKLKDYEVVISHAPYMSFYLALVIYIFRIKTRHHAFSFNHGNGRFFRGTMRSVARKVFQRVEGFVVYSEQEKTIYSDYYKIPYHKFSFTHWATKFPSLTPADKLPRYIREQQPYVCCIGRNNRDFGLFIDVVTQLKLPAIIVAKKDQINRNQLPQNIVLLEDIQMDEAMQVLANARFSVVPLLDASTGAGHITIVSAMQLGIPQIITELSTVSDYFRDGQHGLFVVQGSADSLKEAILKLWDDKALREKMSTAAQSFANKWFSEESSKRHLAGYLNSLYVNRILPCPPEWE